MGLQVCLCIIQAISMYLSIELKQLATRLTTETVSAPDF